MRSSLAFLMLLSLTWFTILATLSVAHTVTRFADQLAKPRWQLRSNRRPIPNLAS